MKFIRFRSRLFFLVPLFAWFVSCKKDSVPTEVIADDPTVRFYSAYSGNVGDTIWIIGKNFSSTAGSNSVTFSTVKAVAIQSKINAGSVYDSIEVVVPPGALTGVLTVTVLKKSVETTDVFWITTGRWIRMADCPIGGHATGAAFAIGNKGYMGIGTGDGAGDDAYRHDFWEFDPDQNRWTQKADFPIGSVRECISFAIGGTGYVGFGINTSNQFDDNNTLFAYDPQADTWTPKATVPNLSLTSAIGLATSEKGYSVTGSYSGIFQVYDPVQDAWSRMTDFPGPARTMGSGFVISNQLFLGAGNSFESDELADLWNYNPSTDLWTKLAPAFSGGYPSVSYAMKGKGYRLLSYPGNHKDSGVYEYDPGTNKWSMKKAFPGISYGYQLGFVVDNRAFITGGQVDNGYSAETWEFIP